MALDDMILVFIMFTVCVLCVYYCCYDYVVLFTI